MKTLLLFISFVFLSPAYAFQHLAVGQGVSAPHQAMSTFFSKGFTNDNPFSAAQLNGGRLTAAYTELDSNTSGYGAEFGFGNGKLGFQVGHYDQDCTNCEGDTRGALGFQFADIGVGLGFMEDIYSLGFIFNPDGQHRFGITADSFIGSTGSNNDYYTFGVGYAYYSKQLVLTLDASKLEHENQLVDDDRIIVSPGVLISLNKFSVSVTHDLNIEDNAIPSNEDNTWFGLAFHPQNNFSVAFYSDYVGDWNANISLLF